MTGSIRSRAPRSSSPAVRKIMRAVNRTDTGAEVVVRRALHAGGLRFRKNIRPDPLLRCRADIVFPRQKVCVFVDGCFWHGCPDHFVPPHTNRGWWAEKINATVERDCRQEVELRRRAWLVVRVWEHQTRHQEDLRVIVDRVRAALRENASRVAACHGPPADTGGFRLSHRQNGPMEGRKKQGRRLEASSGVLVTNRLPGGAVVVGSRS